MGSLGIVVSKDAQKPAFVRDTLELGPARAAGLKAGDQILVIDGISTVDMSLEEVVGSLRGPVGTWVALTVLSDDDQVELSIVRASPTP